MNTNNANPTEKNYACGCVIRSFLDKEPYIIYCVWHARGSSMENAANHAISTLSLADVSLTAVARHGELPAGHADVCRARAGMCREAKELLEKATEGTTP